MIPGHILNKLCMDGLKERYPDDDGTLKERLDYELSTIQRLWDMWIIS